MIQYSDNIQEEYSSYLDDESGIANNTTASRIWFPTCHNEVIEIVKLANQENMAITISGGGTGISGGRAPMKDWILATDKMVVIDLEDKEFWTDPKTGKSYGIKFLKKGNYDLITVPVGMSLDAVLRCTREHNLLYPPDPTERSSFLGGNFATNASGARSFKFGPTRDWIFSAKIVLANGEEIHLERSSKKSEDLNNHEKYLTIRSETNEYNIPIPDLDIPDVTKHVAGPVLTKHSDPLDIFIGTNGIFGIVTEVTLKLLPKPSNIYSMFVYCDTFDHALELIAKCQEIRKDNQTPFPMSVEYLDSNAINIMQQKDTNVKNSECMILIEQDVYSSQEEEKTLEEWNDIFQSIGITDIDVALTHKENEHHKFLRHWVPEWIISTAKSYGYSIIVSDTSVPHNRFEEFMEFIHQVEDEFKTSVVSTDEKINTVLLGHIGDSHPHLALIPTNDEEAELSTNILDRLIDKTVSLGGSIAAEHGLGKKLYGGKPAIIKQYGERGIDEIRKIKNVLDPKYILCPGNIVPIDNS